VLRLIHPRPGSAPRQTGVVLASLPAALALVMSFAPAVAQPKGVPLPNVGDPAFRTKSGLQPGTNLLFNGWGISPAGNSVSISDMPLKMAISPDGRTLAAVSGGYNNTGLTLIDLAGKKVTQFFPIPRLWNGLVFSADGKRIFVSGSNSGKIYPFDFADGKAVPAPAIRPANDAPGAFLAGMAVVPGRGIYVCDEAHNAVWALDPTTLKRTASIPVGDHPHSCVLGADGTHLYVSNWGSRTVSVVDTVTNKHVRDFGVGLRPNDMALAPDGRLFVACSGDNTVHVIQTRTVEKPQPGASPTRPPAEGVREILSTSLYPASPEGSTPDGVAVAPDGKTLYVVNADNNDVLVADISDRAETRVEGFIPVGWYPTAVTVSPDGGTLLVANGKGLHSTPNASAEQSRAAAHHPHPKFTYIAKLLQGSVSFIRPPTADELASDTDQVKRNSPYTPQTLRRAAITSDGVIPDRPGDPCPIKYVLYIILENRTYDQVYGDFKDANGKAAGNGAPSLVMYGEPVTPNRHQLARDYTLLDNLYVNGEVSVDGHSWCDAAIATEFNERRWIMSYSGHGELPGNEEMETPEAGYLWDQCRRYGVSFKCYGEGSGKVPNTNRGTWPKGRDMNRVSGWIKDLHAAEAGGDLPQFMIMSLGEDHTVGAKPGGHTPDACVGSNDVGIGKIVAAASRSKFWPQMAIFAIEDDAQNGPDHVDAHRTAGLVISPYVKRGFVDDTFYTTASMVRTIELILGLPPMTQYDAGATPMFNTFTRTPLETPYQLRMPTINLNAVNPPKGPGAIASAAMDFSDYDRAPADQLNRILWRLAKGPGVPYPTPVHGALFSAP